jgi:Tfp pilus tip-associated adhesin PilY1
MQLGLPVDARRVCYAFDVWLTSPAYVARGFTNASLADTVSCINATGAPSSDFAQMGQTWSTPTVARIKGYSADPNRPVIIVGAGYDTCEDQDANPNTACAAVGYTRRGNRVFVIALIPAPGSHRSSPTAACRQIST